jgi:hypothetical protein
MLIALPVEVTLDGSYYGESEKVFICCGRDIKSSSLGKINIWLHRELTNFYELFFRL